MSANPPVPFSIAELGRYAVACEVAHSEHDNAALSSEGRQRREHLIAMDIFDGRRRALQTLICTMPAKTLLDAAFQLQAATAFADDLTGNDHQEWKAKELAKILERVLYSALPPVCDAAGIAMDGMPWKETLSLRKLKFFGAEDAP